MVLDIAGTTVNDFGLVQTAAMETMKSHQNALVSIGDANKVMGIPKKNAFEQLCSISGLVVNGIEIEKMVNSFNETLVSQYAVKGNIELMPHANELFQLIRSSGAKLYLNTGFNRSVAAVIVENLGLENILNGYIGSDEVQMGRPKPDMIQLAMKKEGVEYSHYVMKVGDTISDLYEGFSAGCAWNIGVLTGANTYEELRTAPHSQIMENLEPLLSLFKSKKLGFARN